MKWLKYAVGLVVLVLLAWWVREKFFISDETRVRRQLAVMTKAVQGSGMLTLEGCIATDYRDDHGLERSTLIMAIRTYRMQYERLLIFLSELTVEMQPDGQTAKVAFIAKVLAQPRGGLIDSEMFTDRFRVYFRKTDGRWLMYRAESPELKFE